MDCRVLTFSVFLAFFLTGCGVMAARDAQEAEAKRRAAMDAAFTACEQTTYTGSSKHRDLAQCKVNVMNIYIRPIEPFPDLLDVLIASRLSIAARIDRGELSEEDGRLAFAKTVSDLTGERERRNAGRGMVAAQQQAANAATYQAIWGNRKTCTRVGNTVNCY